MKNKKSGHEKGTVLSIDQLILLCSGGSRGGGGATGAPLKLDQLSVFYQIFIRML